MKYTDEDILDLEEALETVGHAKHTRFGLVEPEEWNQREMGIFGHFLSRTYGKGLKEQGLEVGCSHMIIPSLAEKKGRSIFTIQGPSVRAKKALDGLYEKYNCQMAVEFGE